MSAIDEIALIEGVRTRRECGRCDVHARTSIGVMIGAYLREASVLVLVFGFLDLLVGAEPPGRSLHDRLDELPIDWIVAVLAVSMTLLTVGIALERIRR